MNKTAKDELMIEKKRLQLLIKDFMEESDIEKGRVLSGRIKDTAIKIVNLRKEIAGGYGKKKKH